MITLRRAQERGHADHGWLSTYHTFSFADYYDPAHMGVSVLRVINDDTVAAGAGFATHAHRDMEIISYVLEGALEHKDSMGNGSVMHPGEVQRMSAGTGVRHSEFNASKHEPVHFLQIWIVPNRYGVKPGYEQKNFAAKLDGRLLLIVSPDGQDGSLPIHQDARLYASRLATGQSVSYAGDAGRLHYVHVARGRVLLNGVELGSGDGAAVQHEAAIDISALDDSEFLLFDLPGQRPMKAAN